MFCTHKGYFGMGTESIESGDRVWLIRGANVPMVLRLTERNDYRLIGLAYVHGCKETNDHGLQ
jgi:hypothetical protein